MVENCHQILSETPRSQGIMFTERWILEKKKTSTTLSAFLSHLSADKRQKKWDLCLSKRTRHSHVPFSKQHAGHSTYREWLKFCFCEAAKLKHFLPVSLTFYCFLSQSPYVFLSFLLLFSFASRARPRTK